MAYKKKELEKLALAAIEADEHIVSFDDVIAELPCSQKTFFNHKLHELHSLKEALGENKVKIKKSLRKKWKDSDNATVQIALYKLIGSEEEAERLNGTRQKIDATVSHQIDDETVKRINNIYDRIRGKV